MEDIREYSGTIGIASTVTIAPEFAKFSCVNVYNKGSVDMLVYLDSRTNTAVTVEPGDILHLPIGGITATLVNTGSAATLAYRVQFEFAAAGL